MAVLDGESLEFTPMLTDSPLARIHYLVRARQRAATTVNLTALEARIEKLTQRWADDCTPAALLKHWDALSQGRTAVASFDPDAMSRNAG